MLDLKYLITGCSRSGFPVRAQVGTRTVDATVDGLVIEAVSEDGAMGHSFKCQPEDLAAAEEEFAVGNVLTVTLSGAPASE